MNDRAWHHNIATGYVIFGVAGYYLESIQDMRTSIGVSARSVYG
jgi:hypothetical protein